MARRRKDGDWIWLVAELIGVLLLYGLMSPQTRQMICAVGVLAVCAVSIAGTGLIGFGICRFVARSQWAEDGERSVGWSALGIEVNGEQRQLQTASEQTERLGSTDPFQDRKALVEVKSVENPVQTTSPLVDQPTTQGRTCRRVNDSVFVRTLANLGERLLKWWAQQRSRGMHRVEPGCGRDCRR